MRFRFIPILLAAGIIGGGVRAAPPPSAGAPLNVDDVVRWAVEQNPRLKRATIAIDAARGRHIQAGLYPNPVFGYFLDELGDRTGRAGIHTAQISQEIVRGGKLRLSQAAAAQEVDQATLALITVRYAVVGSVRAAFFAAYALQERKVAQDELVAIYEKLAVRTGQAAGMGSVTRLNLLQIEIARERARAESHALAQEVPAALHRLAAVAGMSDLPAGSLTLPRDTALPDYDPSRTRSLVLAMHPEIRSAHVAAEWARLVLRRAVAERMPNVTVSGGYTYQDQNKSHDAGLSMSVPLPVWNQNQGNVRAAAAEAHAAEQNVRQTESDLADRVATAFRTYAAAKERATWYHDHVLGRVRESVVLTEAAQKAGQFNALDVLQAEQTAAEARLEYLKALGEAWQGAAELSGLLLEESWPPAPMPPQPR